MTILQRIKSIRAHHFLFVAVLLTGLYYDGRNYWRSVWADPWALVMGIMVIFVGYRISRLYHWSLGVFISITLGSALWAFAWVHSYPILDLGVLMNIHRSGAYAFSAVSIFSLGLLLMGELELRSIKKALACVCIIDGGMVLYQTAKGMPPATRGGILGNPSISGCFMAFTIPMIWSLIETWPGRRNRWKTVCAGVAMLLPILALYPATASQPLGVFLCVFVAFMMRAGSRRTELLKVAVGACAIIIAIAALVFWASSDPRTNPVFNSSGRFAIWDLYIDWWITYGKIWTGQGTGITRVLLPLIQKSHMSSPMQPTDWWVFAHSDWLQTLFENGIIGAISAVVMYAYALLKSWRKAPWLFASVVGIGAAACFNFPSHWPMTALAGATVLAMTFDRKFTA
jgi:hypothetical protein